MVSYTWEILHTTTADEDDRVLLEIVAFAADVADSFLTIRETDLRDLSESGVWFLWGHGVYLRTDTALLRTRERKLSTLDRVFDDLKDRGFALADLVAARLSDELVDSRHERREIGDRRIVLSF